MSEALNPEITSIQTQITPATESCLKPPTESCLKPPTEFYEIRRYESNAGVVIHARHLVGDMIGSPLSFHGEAQLAIQGRGQITLRFPIPAATLEEAFEKHLECAKIEQQRVIKEIQDNERRHLLMQNAQNVQQLREHRKLKL